MEAENGWKLLNSLLFGFCFIQRGKIVRLMMNYSSLTQHMTSVPTRFNWESGQCVCVCVCTCVDTGH
jgi:hypothetical protein